MRRVETGETYIGEVPLALFQGSAFKSQKYLEVAVEIVLQGAKNLGISQDEPIHVCSGYILIAARDALKERGFRVTEKKITGKTQELAKNEFIESLVRLGMGDKDEVAELRSFDSFLRWVHEDLGSRERFVKTGWTAWSRLKREGRK
ncbi:MAG: hypothetical protein ACETVY_02055 [Candidatus Bathyarchaeia archaeon]